MKLIKPPTIIDTEHKFSIFLAGSIEMGAAEDWQSQVQDELKEYDIVVLSPRRDDWDSSWEQTTDNVNFVDQVMWELNGLDEATYIVIYFDPTTKSPISLLELGLYAATGKVRVVCPDGFWRKGNVEIVCGKSCVPLYDSLDEWLQDLKDIHLYTMES